MSHDCQFRMWLTSTPSRHKNTDLISLLTTMPPLIFRQLLSRSVLYTPSRTLLATFSYTKDASPASLLSPTDSLPTIRNKLRAIGEGSVDFDPSYAPGIALITLNNPSRHNALSGKMMAELADVVDTLERWTSFESKEREDLVGLILTGSEGKSFCAGLGRCFPEGFQIIVMIIIKETGTLWTDSLILLIVFEHP